MTVKWSRVSAFVLALIFAASFCWADESSKSDKNVSEEVKRIQKATEVLNSIMSTPDKGIPRDVLASAKCVAVVPSMMKAGFIVGGRYGRGIATCHTASGKWSAAAPFTIAGGDWGLQIGGEAIDLVMLVMNDKGMRNLLSSNSKSEPTPRPPQALLAAMPKAAPTGRCVLKSLRTPAHVAPSPGSPSTAQS